MSPVSTAVHAFSFIVANYNYERFLDECLLSVVSQEYDSAMYEVICVDDGSTDGSWDRMQEFCRRHTNLKAIRTTNSGLEKACNLGLRAARHAWVIRVDSDDILMPGFLGRMNAAIAASPDSKFYYCRDYVEHYSPDEEHTRRLPAFDSEEIFSRGDFFATGTVYSRQALLSVGGFPERDKNCGLENYAVVLELISRGMAGCAVTGAAFKYRRHTCNMSVVQRDKIIAYGRVLLHRHGREYQTNEHHPYALKL
jgi:glycosyltransferase involved in cell wall biosynthesis